MFLPNGLTAGKIIRQKESRNTCRRNDRNCQGRNKAELRRESQPLDIFGEIVTGRTSTITQVLVVLAFMVDIFTMACSFFSCSIKDLRKEKKEKFVGPTNMQIKKHQSPRRAFSSHVLFLQQLHLLLELQVMSGTDGNPAPHRHSHRLVFR